MQTYRLYKSKAKLSSLLQHTVSIQPSFYVLAANGTDDDPEIDTIWFNRWNGTQELKKSTIDDLKDLEEVCVVYGYIGKYQVSDEHSPRLLFVKNFDKTGQLRVKSCEHLVCKVIEIFVVVLGSEAVESLANIECDFNNLTTTPPQVSPTVSSGQNSSTFSPSTPVTGSTVDSGKAKLERKINEEIVKIFQENGGSFYFSPTFDLTNSIERQEQNFSLDDRFFWNKSLLSDLLSEKENSRFIFPLIQGFIKIESFTNGEEAPLGQVEFRLCLISRRSRFRLGTRFKRRGIDDEGNVANFVETEQIIDVYDGHTLAFVIIRGSVPIFWAQSGIKYRPAPRIEKSFADNCSAFQKHFKQLEENYTKSIVIINLVEEVGREGLLGDAFIEQSANLDSDNITYVQFDFHEHCKNLNYQNVSILIDKIQHLITGQFYTWVDKKGFIFKQDKILRVNCIDCLDRTNVVQTVISKIALENQLGRLGFLIPPANLPSDLNKKLSLLWADNGDAISQQYAGTGALKADFTRTGERNLLHAVKDGMKSANRYYQRFKDQYRQLGFEVLQGLSIKDEAAVVSGMKLSNSASNLNDKLNSFYAVDTESDQMKDLETDETEQLANASFSPSSGIVALGSGITRFFTDSESVQVTEMEQATVVYMPQLSLNQYMNKEDKILDLKRFIIKNSKTEMILL